MHRGSTSRRLRQGLYGLIAGFVLGYLVVSCLSKLGGTSRPVRSLSLESRPLERDPDFKQVRIRVRQAASGHNQQPPNETSADDGAILAFLQLERLKKAEAKREKPTLDAAAIKSSDDSDEAIERTGSVSKTGSVGDGSQEGMSKKNEGDENSGSRFHTLVTSNGSPYLNFQTRIMHATYKNVQKMPGGENMVAFTRILHRMVDDELMDEIPTWRTAPLDPSCDNWCEFPVGNRARAVRQFFEAAELNTSLIQAPWILMLEGDYVWMKPLSPPKADSQALSWVFPYNYIVPTFPSIEGIMRKMYPEENGPITDVTGSGPSPVLLRPDEWKKVVHDWERLSRFVDEDTEAKAQLGWVREMYAFSVSLALQGVKVNATEPPNSPLMSQPPADSIQGNAALFHYTWATIVQDKTNNVVWQFEKRQFTAHDAALKIEELALPPPWKPGYQCLDRGPWTEELWNTTTAMLNAMNAGIRNLPDLRHKKIVLPNKKKCVF